MVEWKTYFLMEGSMRKVPSRGSDFMWPAIADRSCRAIMKLWSRVRETLKMNKIQIKQSIPLTFSTASRAPFLLAAE